MMHRAIEKDETEHFDWKIDDINEKIILNSITARTIKEWHHYDEDNIWK